ncbi:MAG: FMN-binding negative transcriptional regulator [Chitinophagaceae bacterium]
MYNIPYFKDKDPRVVIDFMKEHSFALLTGCSGDLPAATQVPFLIAEREGRLFLRGHIMRNTDHHKAFVHNSNVLCVFSGAHTHVSARLYDNPNTASTWNYMTVHARGQLTFLETHALMEILQETTDHYEADDASPAAFRNLPADYVANLSKAITGFEIEVTSVEHVFKLSQNKKETEYERIVTHLAGSSTDAQVIAGEMDKRKDDLF